MIPDLLRTNLVGLESVVVAYSGGVDSTYLAYAAHRVLGGAALAVIADSASLPRAELDSALSAGFPIEVVQTDEFTRPEYLANAPDRCFHCKEALFDRLLELASTRGYQNVALGTVVDDLSDVRPGLASARRRGARQPLVDSHLTKSDVRTLARKAGLEVWDKPQAACLSSRIPHGTLVTLRALEQVEMSEAGIRSLGFSQVRVRHQGDAGRVEVLPEDVVRLQQRAPEVRDILRNAGYKEMVIDTRGYRPRLPITKEL